MVKGTVVVYFSRLGPLLRGHQRSMLTANAKSIAAAKQYDFGGDYDATKNYSRQIYFVPDDTLLLEEANRSASKLRLICMVALFRILS